MNSSSVRMPCAFSSPSSLSWSIVDCPPAGAAASGHGGGLLLLRASCCAQRWPWRRETRLLTVVAVPAMTAVRATPRSSPGMVSPFPLGYRFGRVEGGEEGLDGDAAAGYQLAARAANGGGERRRPAVLEDEQSGRGAGLERVGGLGDVVIGEQARGGAVEGCEARTSSPRSAISSAATDPSSPLAMKARSRIRIRPRSTRSIRCGIASPVGWRPGHSTIR